MKIPTTLKHKPVIVANDYDRIDGYFANDTDAKGLSLGLAQWNDRGKVDISCKVWRYTGEKWSRQSEELPMHRAIDLVILLARSMDYFREAYRYRKLYDPEDPQVDRIGVQGDAMDVSVCTDNPCIDQDIQLFDKALHEQDEFLSERLHLLTNLLLDMGYGHRGPHKE